MCADCHPIYRQDGTPVTRFHGWARMALPLHAFNVIEVKPPRVGEAKPAAVTADIIIDTARARHCS
jgi:intron-binding protein aquarius